MALVRGHETGSCCTRTFQHLYHVVPGLAIFPSKNGIILPPRCRVPTRVWAWQARASGAPAASNVLSFARSTTRSMSVFDVESQFAHSFARTPDFVDGHLAEQDEAMQHHSSCHSVWRHVETNLNLRVETSWSCSLRLIWIHLTDHVQICSQKRDMLRGCKLILHTARGSNIFFAQDLQKPSEPGLNGCVKCSWFHCQHLYIHLMWCNVMWCVP